MRLAQKLHYYSCILCCFRKVAKYTEEKNKNREKIFLLLQRSFVWGVRIFGVKRQEKGGKGVVTKSLGVGEIEMGGGFRKK